MFKLLVVACCAAVAWGSVIPLDESPQGLIVGGKDTDITEVPYLAAFFHGDYLVCGSSLVSSKFVVTAAHCVDGVDVGVMSFRVGTTHGFTGGEVVYPKRCVMHPKYDSFKVDYDVAVCQFNRSVEFSKSAQPIELATHEPKPGASVRASGWGLVEEDGALPLTLQSVFVPVVDRKTCEKAFPNVRVTDRMVCAGVEGKDSCQGDSGGPLESNGKLVGVVSFGIGCARKGKPGVYTNVANHEVTDFIKNTAEL